MKLLWQMNRLKVCFLADYHSLTGYGMREFQSLGMQIQPFGFLSVELIADNGAVQSERMGGMHPELMGASGAGIKGDAGMIVLAFQHFKVGYGGLAMLGMYHLPRAVERVQA